jgi:hypothetical protein
MRRFFAALLGLVVGYSLFAFVGYWAIELFSGNNHDRDIEALMSAAFAFGPIGAVIGLVTGAIVGGRRRVQ